MTPAPNSPLATRWSPFVTISALGLVTLGFAATWDAWSDILWIATRDEEQSHVLLAPVVAGWLVWVRRARLRRCPRSGCWVGPTVVACGWAAHALGDLYLIQAAWHLGAVLVPIGCFLSIAGRQYVTRLLAAFVVLLFVVPVPGVLRHELALPLQRWTAESTRRVLEVVGVDVTRTGNALTVNGRDVLIAEACNGLRMVFALFLVSYTFAYSMPVRNPVRVLIVALSPVTAVLCNVIRLVPTVWIHGHVSTEMAERVHDIGGWVMLPVAFLILLGVFRLLRWALLPVYRFTLAYGR